VKPRQLRPGWAFLPLAAILFFAAQVFGVAETRLEPLPQFVWKRSLPIRPGDPQTGPIGGTEVRSLVVFDKRLFAAIGYWMDTETTNPALPGAQVLRLDSPDAKWQVDLQLNERTQQGLRDYLAMSTLKQVRFTIDSAGRQLAQPVDLLLASVWKRTFGLDIFSRVIGSGATPWSKTTIPGDSDTPRGAHVRAFALHKDLVTGEEMVFAGATNAVRTGKFDSERQRLVWNPQAELQWRSESYDEGERLFRVSSLAECNGKLYATSRGGLYERVDGSSPSWNKIFETTIHARNPHVTGLRGLTCMHDPSQQADVLLAGVEDNPSRIYRINPLDVREGGQYGAVQELDVSAFLTRMLGTRTTYAIVAYNDMTEYDDDARTCPRFLIGLEAITPQAYVTFGTQRYNTHAYYLLRNCDASYALRQIRDFRIEPEPTMVAVRTFALSPFQADPPGTVYAGGYDANRNPVHNTAWLYKGVPKDAAE